MSSGKTIQIYIPDGSPRGIRIAEITSRTVQAILIPRSNLEDAFARDELNSVGVYFLIGNPQEEVKPLLYVGEAEDCLTRLKQHNKAKDFWNVALVIVSKTRYFTKTHVKFLEWYCLSEAAKAGRYRLENSSVPSQPYVPEPVQVDLLDNFETVKILVSTLGCPIFDEIKKPVKKDILTCKGRDAHAEGEYSEEGFVVFIDSRSNIEESKTASAWIHNLREKLIEEQVLLQDGNTYRFTRDYIFASPTAAAVTVLGRNANGWTEWKYEDGRTLDEVVRQGQSLEQGHPR